MHELIAKKEELEKRQKWFNEMETLTIEFEKGIEHSYREMVTRFEDIKLAVGFASQKNTDELFDVEQQIKNEEPKQEAI